MDIADLEIGEGLDREVGIGAGLCRDELLLLILRGFSRSAMARVL